MEKNNFYRTIIKNKKAYYNYYINNEIECGISLQGWEVKSIRAHNIQITDGYAVLKNNEIYITGISIMPLMINSSNISNNYTRMRKLLLNRKEIINLYSKIKKKGYTLIILSLYWKRELIKVNLGIGKGKKSYDKRLLIKKREWKKNQEIIIKRK